MTHRARLTKREKAAMYAAQDNKCANCGSYYPLHELQGEHYTPVAFGNGEKPDALWCRPCHAQKTASDRKKIAKVDRLRGETKQKKHRKPWPSRPMQSRPFPSQEQRRRWLAEKGLA